jgi:tRNA threonylcarbamoyladenosine biosynthesis protein TsaB
MRILAVDTNSAAGSIALLEDRELVAELNLEAATTHSERLLAGIDSILKASGLESRDIDGYALAVGPGSFTGIRIGMGTVKGMAAAHGRPIVPVSNLEALAYKLRLPQARLLCPLIDAKKNEIYAALYEVRSRRMREIIPQEVYKPDLFFSRLPSQRVISFLGSGAGLYRSRLRDYIKDKARFPHRSLYIAYEVALIGHEQLKAGKGKDSRDVTPLYLRRSQAEEQN